MFSFHSAFGLLLKSSFPIPSLPQVLTASEPDICVYWKSPDVGAHNPFPSAPDEFSYIHPETGAGGHPLLRMGRLKEGGYFSFLYADGARFAVSRDGREIWADWPESYALEDVCIYLVGHILAFALRLRGVTCLHASSVILGDQAIAILGAAGAGKSTTAAAFALSGYAVLSDDVVALQEEKGAFLVLPGYPRVNLWPDAVEALLGPGAALPAITPTWGKQFLSLERPELYFASRPYPLSGIYFLSDWDEQLSAPVIGDISGSDALVTLAANAYLNFLLDEEMRRRDFELFSRLAQAVPLRRVRCPARDFGPGAVCEIIAADARRPPVSSGAPKPAASS